MGVLTLGQEEAVQHDNEFGMCQRSTFPLWCASRLHRQPFKLTRPRNALLWLYDCFPDSPAHV